MNNEELKKKILEIFEKAIGDWYEKDDGLFAEGYTPEEGDNRLKAFMADALIAAGIRDMSDIRALADNVMLSVIAHKAEVSSMEQRAKEAELRAEVAESELERYTGLIKPLEDENTRLKHRAEVAERALQKFAETITCEDCPFSSDCASSEKMEDLIHSSYCFAEYLRQAEKELAEEGKDEQD